MAIIIIMGFGFLFMVFAAMEFEKSGSSSMIWLVLLIYFIWENFVSPVALSFITKLSQ
jgi:POT family proton-dependent oligopeptide transporter